MLVNRHQTSVPSEKAKTTDRPDVRRERTYKRLADAVLALASERDITAASVSELAVRAGINRTTFYLHAESPVKLLIQVLASELDLVRRRGVVDLEKDRLRLPGLLRRGMGEVIDHVIRHKAIYGGAGRGSSLFALRLVLGSHIEETLLFVIREGFVKAPSMEQKVIELYAAYIAQGMVGAVEAWLRSSPPRDREILLDVIDAMYPSWYAPHLDPSDLAGSEKRKQRPPER